MKTELDIKKELLRLASCTTTSSIEIAIWNNIAYTLNWVAEDSRAPKNPSEVFIAQQKIANAMIKEAKNGQRSNNTLPH